MKVTYLGEAEDSTRNAVTWFGHLFKKGEPVEIDDKALAEKMSKNRFFKIESGAHPAPAPVPAASKPAVSVAPVK